jgi:hypothetical protein
MPGTIGPIAAQEARAHLRAQLLVAAAALTARPRRPRIETAPRDTERPTQPPRQIPRCFAIKPNFISIPSRSMPRLFLGYPARPSASVLRAVIARSQLLRLHLTMPWKRMLRIGPEIFWDRGRVTGPLLGRPDDRQSSNLLPLARLLSNLPTVTLTSHRPYRI